MGDEYIVAPARSISHTGDFEFAQLFQSIQSFLKNRGYDLIERKHEYKDFPEGRVIEILMLPQRKVSDDDQIMLEFLFIANNVKQRIEGKKKIDNGNVFVNLRAILFTDIEDNWNSGNGPISQYFGFFRWISDNVLFRYQKEQIKKMGLKDIEEIYDLILLHFNSHQFKRG